MHVTLAGWCIGMHGVMMLSIFVVCIMLGTAARLLVGPSMQSVMLAGSVCSALLKTAD